MAHPAAAALSDFIAKTHAIWARESEMKSRMEQTQVLLTDLVRNPVIQDSAKNWPSTEGHKNLLLHTDETYGFIINAVVREPNRKGTQRKDEAELGAGEGEDARDERGPLGNA